MMGDLIRRVVPERFRPIGYLTHLVRTRTGRTVRLGPFQGMRYVENSIGSAYLPKLLGTYERELTRVVKEIRRLRPGLIIDAGSAEGYYAVGLALLSGGARVVAFEREESGRCALSRLAELNRVRERVEIRGECSPFELGAALVHARGGEYPSIVLCDVEGDEDHLLNPLAVPGLARAFILVETHEFVCPGITGRLQERFAATHAIELIWQTVRAREDFPFHTPVTWFLPAHYLLWAVSEWRPERMCWLWMRPNASAQREY
jgi:hypothetical protein